MNTLTNEHWKISHLESRKMIRVFIFPTYVKFEIEILSVARLKEMTLFDFDSLNVRL